MTDVASWSSLRRCTGFPESLQNVLIERSTSSSGPCRHRFYAEVDVARLLAEVFLVASLTGVPGTHQRRTAGGRRGACSPVAFSGNKIGARHSAGDGKVQKYSPPGAKIWDPTTGKELQELVVPLQAVFALAFSPDGKSLASGGGMNRYTPRVEPDNTIRLWEVISGKEHRSLAGHQGAVLSLAFSTDGKKLVSGGEDTTGLVWDVLGLDQHGRLLPVQLSEQGLKDLWDDLACRSSHRRTATADRQTEDPPAIPPAAPDGPCQQNA